MQVCALILCLCTFLCIIEFKILMEFKLYKAETKFSEKKINTNMIL